MTEVLFTITGISWMVLFFHSLNQIGKTFNPELETKFAYVTQLDSFGGN